MKKIYLPVLGVAFFMVFAINEYSDVTNYSQTQTFAIQDVGIPQNKNLESITGISASQLQIHFVKFDSIQAFAFSSSLT